MTDRSAPVQVVDNEDEDRFEVQTPEGVAELTYDRRDGKLFLLHTGVPRALEGRGIGGALVQAALDQARDRGHKVVPYCSFARAYVDRHPEHASLVVLPE